MNTAASSKSNIDPVSENIPVLLKLVGRVIEMASRVRLGFAAALHRTPF
jgi:hypothetical protein